MKRLRKDSAVSPVIAVLLILAMTVTMAGVVGVVVLSMGNVNGAPAAGILIDEKGGVITITHYAGDALKDGTYAIMVDDTDRTEEFKNAGPDDGYFGPGDILSWPINSGSLRHVAVVYNSENGSFMLAEKWFEGLAGDGSMSAAFTMSSSTGFTRDKMPPALHDSAADLTGGYPMTVSFTAAETSSDAEYLWTFGNGNTSNVASPSNQEYTSTGEYTITLKVTNTTNGGWNSSSQVIAVKKPGVTAMAWVKVSGDDFKNVSARFWTNKYPSSSTLSDEGYQWSLQKRPMGFEFKVQTITNVSPIYYYPIDKIQGGSWYHVAGLYDQSIEKSCILYVNGTPNTQSYNNNYPHDSLVSAPFDPVASPSAEIELGYKWAFPWVEDSVHTIYESEKASYL